MDVKGQQPSSDTATPPEEQTPILIVPETSEQRFLGPLYKLRCPSAGLFECSLTSLVFQMKAEGEVVYSIVQWDEGLLYNTGQSAAGPLFKIDCAQGSVCQLQLPHCEVLTGKCGTLSVAHVAGGSVELVPPIKVTDSHAVVDITGVALCGLVRGFASSVTIEAKALLFLQLLGPRYTILNIVIIPRNVPFSEAREMHESSIFLRVDPYCKLTVDQKYSVTVVMKGPPDTIQPNYMQMYSNYGPNYHPTFQVFLSPQLDEVEVSLVEYKTTKAAWKRLIQLVRNKSPEPKQLLTGPVEEQMQTMKQEFIERISLPMVRLLMKELRKQGIIDVEEDKTITSAERAETACLVVDSAVKKGPEACTFLKDLLIEEDPYLSDELGLKFLDD